MASRPGVTGSPRRSYRARVLLVPLDDRSHLALHTVGEEALSGVTVLGAGTRAGDARRLVAESDILVLLVHDLGAADLALVDALGQAARADGRLLAAVIVNPELVWRDEASKRGATVLREAVDTVVVLSDLVPALGFLQTLRGGRFSS